MSNPLARDLNHVLEHARSAFEELRGARIFVTGGTGFFGCWLLESFAWACDRLGLNASVTALTRSPEAFRAKAPHLASHPAIRLVEGDVRSYRPDGARFSHVIHAATASAKLGREEPLPAIDTIVGGVRNTLDMAVAAGARRYLFTSSGAVYGRQPEDLSHVPEDCGRGPDPLDLRSVYGEGKRVGELLCAAYSRQYGLECLIARGFAFVGPYLPLDAEFAIGNFIRDCLEGRAIEVRDGTPYRSYLYAADLAVWLWTILALGRSCRPYNVGSERALTIAELARSVAATLGGKVPDLPDRHAGTRYVPSTSRARTELGLAEWIDLPEAIRRTAAWHSPFFAKAHS